MSRTRLAAPAGFTVVEIIVALTLLGVGVAAWVGTSAVAIRIAGAAGRESAATVAVRREAELRAAHTCPSGGAGTSGGVAWAVNEMPNGVRHVGARLDFVAEGDSGIAAVQVAVICR